VKFLCLAYGDEAGWNFLSEEAKRAALAQDALIRDRGDLMSAVRRTVTSVRNWDGNLEISNEHFARSELPLAGFSVIEAEDVKEVIKLVSNTPWARGRGVVEIRPFWNLDDDSA
jgi:hypothetical protein